MNGIISIKGEISSIEMKEELEKVKGRYPVHLQEDVKKAFQAAEEEDFENASELCCKLLDEKVEPEICMLLGTCYFMMGNMHAARTVFSDLVSDHPKEKEYLIYLGIADHALGRYEEAVKELESLYPLKEYRPFYYTSYGDSLLQLGKEKESRDAFYGDVEFFKNTGIIVSPMMLDGAFQNLLYLDITLGNGKYPEDIKLYYSFLEQIEMTEEMQEALAGNIVYFCELMANKWYRPLFLDFITHIREKGYLKDTDFMKTLDSAFASWESYLYHEDRQVSQMMEAYLSASYKRTYAEENVFMEEETSRIEAAALTYMWYMCQYIPEHPEEMDYIEEHYPYAYADNKAFFGKLKSDPENTAEELLDELYASYVQGASRSEFIESMNRAYKKACENKKESAYVYDGPDTYRRIQPKVGRNAPCPCGSGKKYKKCCGR